MPEPASPYGAPHLLFVPGGGGEGLGESVRAVVLAEAASRRWPGARIGFLTADHHRGLPEGGFERHVVRGKVSRNVGEVNGLLAELSPDVVVFDCRGRGAEISFASRLGARTVYVAAQPQTLRRAFRLTRLRHLDQLWIVQRRFGSDFSELSRSQRLLLALARGPEVHVFDAIFPPVDAARRERVHRELQVGDASYVLFTAGGGGYSEAGRPTSEIFAEAARQVHEKTGRRCVMIMGPLYTGSAPSLPGVTVVESLAPDQMVDLLSGAELVACGGGGLVGQALAHQRVCVVAPAGGPDQPDRIRAYAAQGLLEASPLEAGGITSRVVRLLDDPPRQQAIRARIAGRGFRNGLPEAIQQLERLVACA